MKISSSRLGTNTSLQGGATSLPSRVQGHPMSVLLFGKSAARRVDPRKHPKLKKALRKLRHLADQIAEHTGHTGEDFPVDLCEGDNASISRDGRIAVGVALLEQHAGDDDLLVAILGHEIGHQPWTWPDGDLSRLTKAQRDRLYREEEAKADRFAGRILADLGASPEAVCAYLTARESFEAKAPSDYYPAAERARMIREAFGHRNKVLDAGRAIFGGVSPRKRELR